MPSAETSERPVSAKVVITGGFGVGKTTFVGAVSEIEPLRTEEAMTMESVGVDDTSRTPDKTTTTVAMDFGKLFVEDDLVLYLFGTPGQERFAFMWDDIAGGALGAVILVDTRRLADSFYAIDYCENRGLAFVVAVNRFDGAPDHSRDEVRVALNIDPDIPMIAIDARRSDDARDALVLLLGHLLSRLGDASRGTRCPVPDAGGSPVGAPG